jgi:predicted nucleic acid-binding protein
MQSQNRYGRIFLDTNVYIVGAQDLNTAEGKILLWLGFEEKTEDAAEVVLSKELIMQILRVAKRLRGKDWAGSLISRIWQKFKIVYVLVEESALSEEVKAFVPREDVGVYLTAKQGKADFFISSNYELIRSAAVKTRDFQCLTPEEFVRRISL